MTGESGRILIVDDEAQIRKFLWISLEAHGYGVIEAVRGADGVAKCATGQPDLVVLDLGLPDEDGKEVVRRIREGSAVPILVLSVRQSEAEKVAALDDGADDYVVKPFGIAELLARHAGRIVTHRQLLTEVWGRAHEQDTRYLRVFVGQFRQKLADDPAQPRFIMNEPGVGYRLLTPE